MVEKNLLYHNIYTSLERKLLEDSINALFMAQSKVYVMKFIKTIVNTWSETFCFKALSEIAYTCKKWAVFQKYESSSLPFFFLIIPV